MNETDINTHIVLVTAFIKKGDKYLLARRSVSDPQASGRCSTPGGKVDLETGDNIIEDTIKREIKEEVGIEIEDNIHYLGSDGFIRVSNHHVVALTFLANWKSGEAQALEGQEEVAWYTLDELKQVDYLPNYLKRRLKFLRNYISSA
jgi:ADP-ribose pyrophosphatase YjhB (NUDIX family)